MNNLRPLNILPSWIIPQTPQEKTANDIFWVFFLNKGKSSEFANMKCLEFVINERNKATESLWEIVKDEKINIGINKAVTSYLYIIEQYFGLLWIKTPNNLLDKIKILLLKWGNKFVANVNGYKLQINYDIAKEIPEKLLWEIIIHELVHILGQKQTRIYHKINNEETIIGQTKPSGYSNQMIGGGKFNSFGYFFDEWVVELITLSILHKNWISPYPEIYTHLQCNTIQIYVVDGIIKEIARKTNIPYDTIMNHFIRGNIMGDLRFLNIIKTNLGEDILKELMTLDDWNFEMFIREHPWIYLEKELSKEIKGEIWEVKI